MRRFIRLPVSTQKFVAGVAIGVVLVACGLLSWHLHTRAAAAELHLHTSAANRQAMMELVQRFQAAQVMGTAEVDLSAVVTRSLEGRSFQPSRIQQQEGEIVLRLDNAPFNDVLAWMLELEGTGRVVLGNVALSQGQTAGVTLTLVLRGG